MLCLNLSNKLYLCT